MQKERSNYLAILGVGICLLAVACLYLFQGEYAYADDYMFIVQGRIPSLPNWLAIGRPGTWAYLNMVNEVLHSNLVVARLIGLALAVAAALTAYLALARRGHRPAISIAFALAIPASLPAQLAIVWVNTASSLVAALLAIAAYASGVGDRQRFAVGVLLMSLSCLVYQPAACVFFTLYFLDWVFLRQDRAQTRDLLPLISGGIGLVISFAIAKASFTIFPDVNKGWGGRGELLHDIAPKLDAVSNAIFPYVLNPLFPYIPSLGWFTACLFAAALCGIIFVWRKANRGLGWTCFIAAGYLIAAELPILIVQESWPSFRTFLPWCVLAITVLALAVATVALRHEHLAGAIAAACVLIVGGLNALTIREYVVDSEVAQINEFLRQVEVGVKAGYRDFGIVLTPPSSFDERFRTYELGWLSASASWNTNGMLDAAADRLGLDRNSLRVSFISHQPEKCDCHVVDMRPFWQGLFNKHTLERRGLEREELERKQAKARGS